MKLNSKVATIAAAAVIVVLGGGTGAYASGLIDGADVQNNSLTGADVTGLTGSDVDNGTLTGNDIKNGTLGAGDLSTDALSTIKSEAVTAMEAQLPNTETKAQPVPVVDGYAVNPFGTSGANSVLVTVTSKFVTNEPVQLSVGGNTCVAPAGFKSPNQTAPVTTGCSLSFVASAGAVSFPVKAATPSTDGIADSELASAVTVTVVKLG